MDYTCFLVRCSSLFAHSRYARMKRNNLPSSKSCSPNTSEFESELSRPTTFHCHIPPLVSLSWNLFLHLTYFEEKKKNHLSQLQASLIPREFHKGWWCPLFHQSDSKEPILLYYQITNANSVSYLWTKSYSKSKENLMIPEYL